MKYVRLVCDCRLDPLRNCLAGMAKLVPNVLPGEVDVVVAALKPDLGYLEVWREMLKGCHLIVVQGEAFPEPIRVPEGFDADVYTRDDIVKLLSAELVKKLGFNGRSCRSFGYLMAKRRYVFSMEPDCSPAQDPEGYVVNPVVEHVVNLKIPATPLFFNTLYDPYRVGTDFVRGYPFSWREGVPTAVSLGSWKNATTGRYVDATLTIPRNTLYTMSGINLAFDRSLVGPLMFEPPQLASANGAGELWAGLCCKTICDHNYWGVKTGLPYICRNEANVANEKAALGQGDGNKLDLIAGFFQTIRLSGNPVDVKGCYLELAEQAKSRLSAGDPTFNEVASSMQAWIAAWSKLGH